MRVSICGSLMRPIRTKSTNIGVEARRLQLPGLIVKGLFAGCPIRSKSAVGGQTPMMPSVPGLASVCWSRQLRIQPRRLWPIDGNETVVAQRTIRATRQDHACMFARSFSIVMCIWITVRASIATWTPSLVILPAWLRKFCCTCSNSSWVWIWA